MPKSAAPFTIFSTPMVDFNCCIEGGAVSDNGGCATAGPACDALERVERERWQSLRALERVPWGVLLLDDTGRVWFANAEAKRIVTDGDGLMLRKDALTARLWTCARALDAAIRRATAADAALEGDVVLVEREEGHHPYQVTVWPDAGCPASGCRRGCCLITVIDPARDRATAPEKLGRLFHLTTAESTLAAALADGVGLSEYARAAGITLNTARCQLKAIFGKTGTHRQGELVALLLRSSFLRTPPPRASFAT